MEHFDAIDNSPSQIYQFALPLCPPSSWLCKHYTAELSQAPKVVKGARTAWGSCYRTVLFKTYLKSLSYWNNVIATGSLGGDIITLDVITGSTMAVLSGHRGQVHCVTFSSDGRSLASGAEDNTVKLWDIQTGGIVRTFLGHTAPVLSVSISTDCTRIVSGSADGTMYLWDIQTGEYHCAVKQQDVVEHVSFSLIYPQHIISISGGKVWEWDLNGQQILPTYNGIHIAFSPDCTKFALCEGIVVTVWDSNSGTIETQFGVSKIAKCCCFSPDGRFIAVAAETTGYVWDVSSPDPHLVGALYGHTSEIKSLVFSSQSSLISVSDDKSIKFWQYGLWLAGLEYDSDSTPHILSNIWSVGLQVKTRIAISSNRMGVVKIWSILSGHCKASFETPVQYHDYRDFRLVDDNLLIVVWCKGNQVYIWDTYKEYDPPILVTTLSSKLMGLRISEDGSKFYLLLEKSIQAWSIHTGKPVGEVELELGQKCYFDPLQMDGSKFWIRLEDFSTQGWDFDVSNSPPVPLSEEFAERPILNFIGGPFQKGGGPFWIKNMVTGREVFQLSGRYARPKDIRWDGKYLVAGYEAGEVLILDFCHLCSK